MRDSAPARTHFPIRSLVQLFSVAITLASAGCVSPLQRSVAEQTLRADGGYRIIPSLAVPTVRGVEGCGAQALATVLAYGDASADSAELADGLPWHEVGATPIDLLLAARDRGREAAIARGSWEALAGHVARGQPVLIMFDAAPEVQTLTGRIPTSRVMHWSVVSGVAADGSQVLLAARDARHHVVERDDFLRRWSKSANCMIVVTRKGEAGP